MAAIVAGCVMSCGPNDKAQCEEAAPGVPRLASYGDVQVPGTYWVEMIFDGGEWRPADPMAMPRHHASRLELANLADFPALTGREGERVRFTIEITTREIRQVPGRREWRATYRARIVAVCPPT